MTEEYILKNIDNHNTAKLGKVKVDIILRDVLKKLNDKGYKTMFSCQSNLKFCEPYITFSVPASRMFDTVPKGWELDDNERYEKHFEWLGKKRGFIPCKWNKNEKARKTIRPEGSLDKMILFNTKRIGYISKKPQTKKYQKLITNLEKWVDSLEAK